MYVLGPIYSATDHKNTKLVREYNLNSCYSVIICTDFMYNSLVFL